MRAATTVMTSKFTNSSCRSCRSRSTTKRFEANVTTFSKILRIVTNVFLRLLNEKEQPKYEPLAPGKQNQILMYKDGKPGWVDPPARFVKACLPEDSATSPCIALPVTPLLAGSSLEEEWLQ